MIYTHTLYFCILATSRVLVDFAKTSSHNNYWKMYEI